MYAAAVVPSLLLAALAAVSPAVAVERATGRVAMARGSEVVVLAADLRHPVAALPAPPGSVEVVEFMNGVLVYEFTLPEDGSPARVAVGVEDGRERLIWPNSGIGEAFPSLGARLTADGHGIYEFLPLAGQLRGELGLDVHIPDGAGTVVTYRFADEQVWAIAAADFAGGVALAPGDALLVTTKGEVLRYRSTHGVVWRRPGQGEPAVISDVDLSTGAAALAGEGGVEVVGVAAGESRGSWRRSGVTAARLLGDGRLLAATQGGQVWAVTLASGAAVRLAQLVGGEWPGSVMGGCPGSGPLACLHPAPGGVIVPADGGWQLWPLPPSTGQGAAPPRG